MDTESFNLISAVIDTATLLLLGFTVYYAHEQLNTWHRQHEAAARLENYKSMTRVLVDLELSFIAYTHTPILLGGEFKEAIRSFSSNYSENMITPKNIFREMMQLRAEKLLKTVSLFRVETRLARGMNSAGIADKANRIELMIGKHHARVTEYLRNMPDSISTETIEDWLMNQEGGLFVGAEPPTAGDVLIVLSSIRELQDDLTSTVGVSAHDPNSES